MKTTVNVLIVILVLLAGAGAVVAETQVNETRKVPPGGEISIEVLFGVVEVIGWDRDEIQVEGTVGDQVEGLEIYVDHEDDEVYVEVEIDEDRVRSRDSARADLVIHVPASSFVYAEGVDTEFAIRDVEKGVSVESVNGNVLVTGTVAEVEVETVASNFTFEGNVRLLEAESAAGNITVDGVDGEIEAESVAGNIEVGAIRLHMGDLSTASGNIRIEGALDTVGRLDVESLSGEVQLLLSSGTSADFHISTFSGNIETDFGVRGTKEDRYSPSKSARFSLGDGGFQVNIETFSGTCEIRQQ